MAATTARRWTLWAAAGFLALVLVAGLVAVIVTWVNSAPGSGAARGEIKGEESATTVEGCPSDTDLVPPTTEPPEGEIEWRPLSEDMPWKLPYSPVYGPCTVTDSVAKGFAHTPRGALFAAVHIFIRSSLPGEAGERVIEEQFVADEWRDALLEENTSAEESSGVPEGVEYVAFAISSWSGDSVQVSLANTTPYLPGEYVLCDLNLSWVDGDWRMHAPLGGSWGNAITTTPQLPEGFVTWGPQQ